MPRHAPTTRREALPSQTERTAAQDSGAAPTAAGAVHLRPAPAAERAEYAAS